MFGLNESVRYHLYQGYVDMRKGMDGLYNVIRAELNFSPISGDVFIFFAKNRKSVKLLKWDNDGFILYQKRLEEGTFEVPQYNSSTGSYELSWETIYFIMQGVSLNSVHRRKRFRIARTSV